MGGGLGGGEEEKGRGMKEDAVDGLKMMEDAGCCG